MACGSLRKRDGHSSGAPVARRIVQPTRMTDLDRPEARRRQRHPYSVLLPVGFAVPPSLPKARWALTPPFHPYLWPIRNAAKGGLLSVALSLRPLPCGANPAGHYPAPFVHGARTFLSGHLSALARSGRPAD